MVQNSQSRRESNPANSAPALFMWNLCFRTEVSPCITVEDLVSRHPWDVKKGVNNWSWPLTETFHCIDSHDTYSCIVWYTWGILFDSGNLIFITCSYTTVESHFLKRPTLYNKNQNWLPFCSRTLSVMGFLSDEIIQIKFVKLWDFSGYSKRKTPKRLTYQKVAFQGKLSLRY